MWLHAYVCIYIYIYIYTLFVYIYIYKYIYIYMYNIVMLHGRRAAAIYSPSSKGGSKKGDPTNKSLNSHFSTTCNSCLGHL